MPLRRSALRLIALLLAGLTPAGPSGAETLDPHLIYERKCAGCHPAHAGDFVHEQTETDGGTLTGKANGIAVADFLRAGHGRLSPEEAEVMIAHLAGIRARGGVFHDKCDICHDPASELARHKLILRDGALYGRYTDRAMEDFLTWHGRLAPDQVAPMLEMLQWQIETYTRSR